MQQAFNHFDAQGNAHMVDISAKNITARIAIATGTISMLPSTLELIKAGTAKKGDVLGVARIAAIQACKRTSELIPLCHPIALTHVSVDFTLTDTPSQVHCKTTAQTSGQTGVEMEALTAVSLALLTIYDMCKAVDRGMCISDIALLEKKGGKSGDFVAKRA